MARWLVLVVLLALVLVAGCGGGDEDDASPPSAAGTPPTVAARTTTTAPSMDESARRYLELAEPANRQIGRITDEMEAAEAAGDRPRLAVALRDLADAEADFRLKLIRAELSPSVQPLLDDLSGAVGREVITVRALAAVLDDGGTPDGPLMSDLREAIADRGTAAETLRARLGLPPVQD